MQHHKYSLLEIENMIAWERDIYMELLMRFIKEENERIKGRISNMGDRSKVKKTKQRFKYRLI